MSTVTLCCLKLNASLTGNQTKASGGKKAETQHKNKTLETLHQATDCEILRGSHVSHVIMQNVALFM